MRHFILAIFLSLIFLFNPFSIFAASSPQTVVLQKDETINHNYFATGNSVDIEGVVNGDVYAAGGTVLVNGTVNGDVIAAGGQVTIRGTAQNVRVAGGQIIIDGKVNGNITTLGGSITTTDASRISGSIVGAGGQYSLLGPIDKTVSLAAGQISVDNIIGSDMWLNAQTITFTQQAKVQGNVTYVSTQNAQIASGAVITGKVNHAFPPAPQKNQIQTPRSVLAALAGIKIGFSIISFLVSLVIGLLLLSCMPLYTGRVTEHIIRHPWQSLLIGLITWIVTPFILFILFITLIGIPFAIVWAITISIFSYIGKITVAIVIGQWALANVDKRKNLALALLVGLVIVEIIGFIPIFGWLFSLVVATIGFGAVLFMEKIYYKEFRTKKLI